MPRLSMTNEELLEKVKDCIEKTLEEPSNQSYLKTALFYIDEEREEITK